MKVTVNDIRKITPEKPLISQLDSRLACASLRNLVSYVNMCYPMKGYRYSVHIAKGNFVHISLVKTENQE